MRKNNKGFTLAELLIVVAIIAVLVAIAIPIFTAQLEKSREATDASNIRAAYAELIADVLLEDQTAASKEVKLGQKQDGWQKTDLQSNVIANGYSGTNVNVSWVGAPKKDGTCTVSYAPATVSGDKATVTFSYSN